MGLYQGFILFDPASCRSLFISFMLFETLTAITSSRFKEGFVPGVTWRGGSRQLDSTGKKILVPLSRWLLLVWLTMPLTPTCASSGQPRLTKCFISAIQAAMPWPLKHPWQAAAKATAPLPKHGVGLANTSSATWLCQNWICFPAACGSLLPK